jgi:hypothetical protein
MFCNQCGKETKEGARFCNHCGGQISHTKVAKGKKPLFIVAVSALLLVIGIGGFIAVQERGGSLSGGTRQAAETTPRPKRTPSPTPDVAIVYGGNVAPIYAPAPAPEPEDVNGNKKGDVIAFGGYSWRILAIGEGQNLLISENILEYRMYNEKAVNVTWEECTLRDYLNNVFINNFSADEQARIVETLVANGDNLHTNREGGNDTSDKIFLLSLDEAVRYFDASDMYYYGSSGGYSTTGKAYDANGNAASWWLRSPSFNGGAAAVYDDGSVYAGGGYCVDSDQGNPDRHFAGRPICANIGVRPALWLKVG